MMMEETPLLVFTFLCQLAFGSFVGLGLYRHYLTRSLDGVQANRAVRWCAVGVVVLVAAGVVASFFHVGLPSRAAGMLGNLGASWLSREILTTGLFFVVSAAFAVAVFLNAANKVVNAVFVAGTVLGVAMVASMGCSYASIAAVPAWSAWTTVPFFFVTAALLGCAGTLAFALVGGRSSAGMAHVALRVSSLAALVLLAVQGALVAGWVLSLAGANGEGGALSLSLLQEGTYGFLLALALCLSVVATALAATLAATPRLSGELSLAAGRLAAAVVLAVAIVACELLLKILFYAVAAGALTIL